MNKTAQHNMGIVLLAGGASKRLGSPKQLLTLHSKPLLRHAAEVALAVHPEVVVVVTGAHHHTLVHVLEELDVRVVHNADWQEGMASSLRTGVNHLQKIAPDVDGVICMVCDQPFIGEENLSALIEAQKQTGARVVASSYSDRLGTPALFLRELFGHLQHLQGDTGAKQIFYSYRNEIVSVPFERGSIDIDTQADVENLTNVKSIHD